jgi:penicillin amidase
MPGIFDLWIKKISVSTWEDELGNADEDVEWPNFRVLSDLIVDSPNSKWFDNINTKKTEDLSTMAADAFDEVSKQLLGELGSIGETWKWKNLRGTDVYHLAKVPGFGRMHLPTGGDWNIPNATARTHGPSWRYVVELGDRPRGYGIYPGGQSGFPGSIHYDQFLDSWVGVNSMSYTFPIQEKK